MNAASGGVFAGAGLGKKQYRNIGLRKLPDHSFHGPQACAGAFDEFGHDGVDGDFGLERSQRIVPAWVWFTHFCPSERIQPPRTAICHWAEGEHAALRTAILSAPAARADDRASV